MRWPSRSPPTHRPGPGTWPPPAWDPTTTSPTSWPGWPRATACGWAMRPHPRPSNGPRSSREIRRRRPSGWRPPRRTPSSLATSPAPAPWPPTCSPGSASDPARGHVLFTLGVVEQYAGSVPRSADHLSAACAVLEGAPLVRALTELAMARFRLNDFGGVAQCAKRIDAVADLTDPEQRLPALFTGGVARVLAGDHEAAQPMLTEATTLALSEELRHDPRALLLMALAAGFAGNVGEVHGPRCGPGRRRTTTRRRGRPGPDPRHYSGGAELAGRPRGRVRRRR